MADLFDPYAKWLGISDAERPIDHYRLLGVKRYENDPTVIEDAADSRMLLIRQYQTGPHAAETQILLNEISAAKLCLLNPAARAAYDQMLQGLVTSRPHSADAPAAANHSVTPPVPARHRAAHAVRSDAVGSRCRDVPYYRRVWFLLAALIATVAIAWGVWFVGNELRRSHPVPQRKEPRALTPERPLPSGSIPLLVHQESSGGVNLAPALASLSGGGNLSLESVGLDEVLTGWDSSDDVARWHFQITKLPPQGIFRVKVTYLAAVPNGYLLGVDDEEIRCETRSGQGLLTDEHFLLVPRTGRHQLTIRADRRATFKINRIVLSFPNE